MIKVFEDVISLEQTTFPFVGPNPNQEKSSIITSQKLVIHGYYHGSYIKIALSGLRQLFATLQIFISI